MLIWTPQGCAIIAFYRYWAIISPTFGGFREHILGWQPSFLASARRRFDGDPGKRLLQKPILVQLHPQSHPTWLPIQLQILRA